jgi:hypothetical protein
MPSPTSDPECLEKGIPEHLHQLDEEPDNEFDAAELLFRRFTFGMETLKQIIVFKRMSVNRANHGRGPDDALWNCEEGGRHNDCGVAQFAVGALDQKWEHPTEANISYSLRPEHVPLKCNYPHAEVVVYKEENGTATAQNEIKPTSVKTRIREELGKLLKVALPTERQGETFA